MNFETIKIEIASNPQYVSIVRLTTSGIANKVGFCLDDIEDMKVAVSEACTNAIKHSSDNKFSVEYTIFEDGTQTEFKRTQRKSIRIIYNTKFNGWRRYKIGYR